MIIDGASLSYAAGMSTDAFSDFVVGHGELWSGRLFALCCKQVCLGQRLYMRAICAGTIVNYAHGHS